MLHTAARETSEETGIKITVTRLLGVWTDQYTEPDGRPWPTINLIYLATPDTTTGDLTHVDAHEITALAWHPLTRPPADAAFPTQQLGAIAAYIHPPVAGPV